MVLAELLLFFLYLGLRRDSLLGALSSPLKQGGFLSSAGGAASSKHPLCEC